MATAKILRPTADASNAIADLAIVKLRKRVRDGDHVFEAGTIGTVVFCYALGAGYEIEIGEERTAVVTVSRNDIEPV